MKKQMNQNLKDIFPDFLSNVSSGLSQLQSKSIEEHLQVLNFFRKNLLFLKRFRIWRGKFFDPRWFISAVFFSFYAVSGTFWDELFFPKNLCIFFWKFLELIHNFAKFFVKNSKQWSKLESTCPEQHSLENFLEGKVKKGNWAKKIGVFAKTF